MRSALRRGRGLPSLALGTLVFMVLVILWGAVVRATGSGAGCGDHWPLCNGDWVPQHPRLATIIEFTHRSMSGICTALVAAVLGWTLVARRKGDPARRFAVWSMLLLVTEAFLGAVLVKGGYVEQNASAMRVVMQGIHFTNTMLLLAVLTLTWWKLHRRGEETVMATKLLGVQRGALLATLVVGATGSVAALADTLFPVASLRSALLQDFAAGAPVLVRMRWIHPASAAVALGCALWLSVNTGTRGRWLFALIGVQVALGFADVLLLAPAWMQVLHLLGADVYWSLLVIVCEGVFSQPHGAIVPAVARIAIDETL